MMTGKNINETLSSVEPEENPFLVEVWPEDTAQDILFNLLKKTLQNANVGCAYLRICDLEKITDQTAPRPHDKASAIKIAEATGKPVVQDWDNRANGIDEKFRGKEWYDKTDFAKNASKNTSFNSPPHWLSNLFNCVTHGKTGSQVGSAIEIDCYSYPDENGNEKLFGKYPKGGNRLYGYLELATHGVELFDDNAEPLYPSDYLTKLEGDDIDFRGLILEMKRRVEANSLNFRRLSLATLGILKDEQRGVLSADAEKLINKIKNAVIPVVAVFEKDEQTIQSDVEDEQHYIAQQTSGHKNKRKFSNRTNRTQFREIEEIDFQRYQYVEQNYKENSEKLKKLTTQKPPTRHNKRFNDDGKGGSNYNDIQRNSLEARVNALVYPDKPGFVKANEIGCDQLTMLADKPGTKNLEYSEKIIEYVNGGGDGTLSQTEVNQLQRAKNKELSEAQRVVHLVDSELLKLGEVEDKCAEEWIDDNSVGMWEEFAKRCELNKDAVEVKDILGSKRLFIGSSETHVLDLTATIIGALILANSLDKKDVCGMFKYIMTEGPQQVFKDMEGGEHDDILQKYHNNEKKTNWHQQAQQIKDEIKNPYSKVYKDNGESELGVGTTQLQEQKCFSWVKVASNFDPRKVKEKTTARKREIVTELFNGDCADKIKIISYDNTDGFRALGVRVNLPTSQGNCAEFMIDYNQTDGRLNKGITLGHQLPESRGFPLNNMCNFGFLENGDANSTKKTWIHNFPEYAYIAWESCGDDDELRTNTEALIEATINTTEFKDKITLASIIKAGKDRKVTSYCHKPTKDKEGEDQLRELHSFFI